MDPSTDPTLASASPLPSRVGTPTPSGSRASAAASTTSDAAENKNGVVDLADGPAETSEASTQAPTDVNQMVNQLSSWGGSLWGGFRKQSAVALDTVRKDFSRTIKEAQEELRVLQNTTVEVVAKTQETIASTASSAQASTGEDVKGKGKERAVDESEPSTAATSSAPVSDMFARLSATLTSTMHEAQAHLPAHLRQINSQSLSSGMSSLQKSLQDTIAANPSLDPKNANANLAQLRTSLSQNIQKNLQSAGTSLNVKQAERLAEEYLKKSEVFLHGAQEFLKDAVKVVPPEEGSSRNLGVAWDGSDMYAFSTSVDASQSQTPPASTDEGSRSARSFDFTRASRKDALLRRLRTDRQLLLVDPAGQQESAARRDAFAEFVRTRFEGKGGVEGAEIEKVVNEELNEDKLDAAAFKETRDALVPSSLTETEFWSRYLFHKHMIELEEEKRQNLLKASEQVEKEEDFSWDDAEEDTPKSAELARQGSQTTLTPQTKPEDKRVATLATPAESTPAASASSSASRRASEESYDVVSDQHSEAGKAAPPAAPKQAQAAATAEESDDDWE